MWVEGDVPRVVVRALDGAEDLGGAGRGKDATTDGGCTESVRYTIEHS